MPCQEHMKCPNCGVKLLLCECRGPYLEGSSAVQWEEGAVATARSSSFYNARQGEPRNGWTKVTSLVICGEGDPLPFPFFSASTAVPTSLFGEAGSWLQKLCLEYVDAAPLARHWFALTVTQTSLHIGLSRYHLQTQSFQLVLLSLLTTDVPT